MPTLKQLPLAALAENEKETAHVDFKAEFEDTTKHWCEVLKDIVAMANSGGGVIIFGVGDDGQPSAGDVTKIYRPDPAKITDKIASYTGVQFADLEVKTVDRAGSSYPAIFIGRAKSPLVFMKPGSYPVTGEKHSQKTAFGLGTVYFRHGAKSEPATSEDLRQFIEYRLNQMARSWRKGIRKVVTAPVGHEVHVVPPHMKLVPDEEAQRVRLVNDASAPAARFVKPDESHPYRQKELMPEIIKRLDSKPRLTTHDLLCVRRVHGTDDNPNFTYKSQFGSRQYSVVFAEWIVQQINDDPEFFKKACAENARRLAAKRVNKPR